jgi:hypothetical protein
VVIGRGIRYFGQGYLAVLYGEQAVALVRENGTAVGVGLAILAVVLGVIYYWVTTRRQSVTVRQ